MLAFPKYLQVGRDSFENMVPMLSGRSHRCFDLPVNASNATVLDGERPFIAARKGEVQAVDY